MNLTNIYYAEFRRSGHPVYLGVVQQHFWSDGPGGQIVPSDSKHGSPGDMKVVSTNPYCISANLVRAIL